MKNTTYIFGILFATLMFACNSPQPHSHEEEEGGHAHEAEAEAEDKNKEEVHLLQKQMDVMNIELGKFQFLNLSTTVKSNGQLELPPQNRASISAVIGGRVKSISVVAGDYVKKGQSLALIEHPDFIEIQQEYMTLKSQLPFLEKNLVRKRELFQDSVGSAREFELAEAEFISTNMTINGLKAKMELIGIDLRSVEQGKFQSAVSVRSPISGYVKHIDINIGKFIQPTEEMFEIVDNDHIHIDLMVYEKDLGKVKNGQKVIFSLSHNPDSVYQGTIFSIGRSFEKEPKAMIVHAEIDNNTGNLLPGMYVDARIVTNEAKVQALPKDAIVSDGGLNYIFVLKLGGSGGHAHDESEQYNEEYIFKKIEVNTGANDIGFTEVVPVYNLPEHVEIVTKGAFYLLAEMKKGEGGHGHGHHH